MKASNIKVHAIHCNNSCEDGSGAGGPWITLTATNQCKQVVQVET